MSEQYFTRHRGIVRGPFTVEKLNELARRGQFSRVYHVSLDGVNWESAANHPELLPEARAVNVRKQATKVEDEDSDYKLAPADEQKGNVADPTTSATQNDADNLAAWHYTSGGHQFGPVSFTELRQLAARGVLQSNASVWSEGMSRWTEASNIPGLFQNNERTITCPACHRLLKVTDEAFGKTVRCPLCQHPIAVPAASDARAVHRRGVSSLDEVSPRDSQDERYARRTTRIVAAAAGGIFGLLLVVVVVLWLAIKPESQRQSLARSHRALSESSPNVADFSRLSGPLGQGPNRGPTDAEAAGAGIAACASCGGATILVVFLVIAIFALNIALLVWVARDAKARGMDSAVLWMLLVMFTGLIGLVIYLLSRPQGNVVPCPSCGNKRLQAAVQCPHCGNP